MTELLLTAPMSGWALSLDEVPDAVFASGMMGPGAAIDPTGDTLYAPADAVVVAVHRARHAVTLALTGGPEILIHVGLDTVALDGGPFTPLVAEGEQVSIGTPLLRFDLDRIVQSAPAAATPAVVTSEGWRVAKVETGRALAHGDPWMRLVPDAVERQDERTGELISRTVQVGLPHGLHARPAARIVAVAREHGVIAHLVVDGHRARCASPTALLALGLPHGAEVTIDAQGDKAAAAVDAIAALLEREVDGTVPATRQAPARIAVELPDGAIAGVTAAPGLALGTAHWLRRSRVDVAVAGEGIEIEQARLVRGIAAVEAQLAGGEGQAAGVIEAHRAILLDPDLRAAAEAAIGQGAHAAAAFVAAADAQAATLRALSDARLAERGDDIEDVGQRVAHAILGTSPEAAELPAGAALLAEDLLPSQLIALDAARLAAIVLVAGGPTSHVAILAAGLGVPMLVAAGPALRHLAQGTALLVDADAGHVVPDPDPVAVERTRAALAARAAAIAAASTSRAALTADGIAIPVQANLGSRADAEAAASARAEGSGLVRTEFLFLDRTTPPGRTEQSAAYHAITDALPSGRITIRLLDVGGDKPAPYLDLPAEENPALGLRGVRVSLARPEVLEAQLAAIVALPALDRCRIMVPMVASADELDRVRAVLTRLCEKHGVAPPPLGAMIETPAAAVTADLIAAHADFLSIGSNDLTQYVLAMDRGNAAVAASIDGLHPAVLRMVRETCRGAAVHGVPVGVCGGLAADPLAVPILLGLGVTSLSVPPALVVATRALVATVSMRAARDHAAAVLSGTSAAEIRSLARHFAEDIQP